MLRPVICLCDPKAAKGGKTIIIWLWNLQDFHHTYKLIFPLSVDYLERCMLETSERSATCLCPRRASVFGQPVSVIKQHLSNEVSRKFSNVPSSVPKAFRLARIHVWICWGNVKAISREFKVGKKKKLLLFPHLFFFFFYNREENLCYGQTSSFPSLNHVPLILWNQKTAITFNSDLFD